MSEYYESLGSNEKARYIAKLEAVGLTLGNDPYSKESGRKFETNMASWPPLEYGYIFGYFISLAQVCMLSNNSYPGSSYRVITISKATMLELCI